MSLLINDDFCSRSSQRFRTLREGKRRDLPASGGLGEKTINQQAHKWRHKMDRMKILLVDDEQEFVTTLAERLELRNMNVSIATDGEAALGFVENDPPQVVVLDVMMPGLSGLEVLEKIKAMDSKIQVILLTGHGATKDGIRGMQLGAFDYLIKPIDIDELIEKLNEAIKSMA